MGHQEEMIFRVLWILWGFQCTGAGDSANQETVASVKECDTA